VKTKTPTTIANDFRAYLSTGGGADAPIVNEWAAQFAIYLRS
jgi:hypothetical protein